MMQAALDALRERYKATASMLGNATAQRDHARVELATLESVVTFYQQELTELQTAIKILETTKS